MTCEVDRDKPLTWFERIAGTLAIFSPFIGIALVSLMCGDCINCIVRHSPREPHITSVYQCTRMAAAVSIVMACPQMMSDAPSHGFEAMNLLTIPCGIVFFCVDVPCELVLDTVCLPYDIFQLGGNEK